jgi:hypothetical protein
VYNSTEADGDRDTPVVRNLPIKVTSREPAFLVYRHRGLYKPMEEGDLKLIAYKAGRLHLGKTKLSVSTKRPQKLE